jgi:hypothetical protein
MKRIYKPMPNQTKFSGNNMIARSYHCVLLALFSVFLLVRTAWDAGIWLYESGAPDLGTAGAGMSDGKQELTLRSTNSTKFTKDLIWRF